MNTVAVIPVHGRIPLLPLTIGRLVKNNIKVISCGHTDEEKDVCEKAGADFIQVPSSTPLGQKWQCCIDIARLREADAVCIMGSSDWISNNWVGVLSQDFDKYGMVGTAGILFLDVQANNQKRMIHWGGYAGQREGEPIGTGRILSRRLLAMLDWQVFDRHIDHSLDYSTMKKIWAIQNKWGFNPIYCSPSKDIAALSISTYRWVNKHNFERESAYPTARWIDNPDEILNKYFPEGLNIFGE